MKACHSIRFLVLKVFSILLPWACQSFTTISSSTFCYRRLASPSSVLNLRNAATTNSSIQTLQSSNPEIPFKVSNVDLNFVISKKNTRVTSRLTIHRSDSQAVDKIVLNGDSSTMDLISISINDEPFTDYTFQDKELILHNLSCENMASSSCVLETVVDIKPHQVRELEGLFLRRENNGSIIMSHCEPQGFRKISPFFDRPDVCAIYQTRIQARKEEFPILLSNGNLIEQGEMDDGQHYVVYHDPHPKPCYLFGLVASKNLKCLRSQYITQSGATVDIEIYGEPPYLPRLEFAMDTVQKAMKWDEGTFGLEYDLNVFRLVASPHFLIGAMENKGLNLFLASLIATDPFQTTDVTYDLVEKTIAHEYFHNWSGNRVTLKDWNEFTLKEGLTVYRDQRFTSDVGLALQTRIEAVKILREKQFAEDANPTTRHPIRPARATANEEKQTLDTLATSTTYHKGAEVCRMLEIILGRSGFRKGLELYINRHDGTGATCDDFCCAMAEANPEMDLEHFRLWYSTAGTPTLSYEYAYSDDQQQLDLTLSQTNPSGQILHIPVAVGLLDTATGVDVIPTTVLNLKQAEHTFSFHDLKGPVVVSMLRGFSAPVCVQDKSSSSSIITTTEKLAFLAKYETDGFNKWEAMQKLYELYIFEILYGQHEDNHTMKQDVLAAFERTLNDPTIDPSTKSYLLNLPTEAVMSREMETIDPVGLHAARSKVKEIIAQTFQKVLQKHYDELTFMVDEAARKKSKPQTDTMSRAVRSLRNTLLDYLCGVNQTLEQQKSAAALAVHHFERGKCLTDKLFAFRQLASMSGDATIKDARNEVTKHFYEFAKNQDAAVMNKWFQTQALADLPDLLERVQALTQNPEFKANNAGRFRSLITSFTMNAKHFHSETGNGYRFVGDIIRQMDQRAPPLAVELAQKLAHWRRYDPKRAALMNAELTKLAGIRPISKSLLALVTESLPESGSGSGSSTTCTGNTESVPKGSKSKKKSKRTKPKSQGFS